MVMFPSRYPLVFLPASTSIRVVFPAPLTPISAVSTPGLKYPLTPFRRTNLSRFILTADLKYPECIDKRVPLDQKVQKGIEEGRHASVAHINLCFNYNALKPHLNSWPLHSNSVDYKVKNNNVRRRIRTLALEVHGPELP
ncbi:hypothetical protein IEQ34_003332 [Dendrobium chrysotoxum]|uniref:Uncharacterized protein n=1 Tax=Dendrobium chrysotoxum TaxID=161865 RepID=A0AAV7H3G8_DENCH|nr:hypothetical protein IEQ34_003332 [Dendrobium chrysotoxum]